MTQAARPSMMTWCELLREARAEKGISLAECARRFQTSRSEYEAWEAGTSFPQGRQLLLIGESFPRMRNMRLLYDEQRKAVEAAWEARKAEKKEPPPLENPPLPTFSFGTKLRAARIALGFTQADIAELLGVNQTAVSGWETDQNRPLGDHFRELQKMFPQLESVVMGVTDAAKSGPVKIERKEEPMTQQKPQVVSVSSNRMDSRPAGEPPPVSKPAGDMKSFARWARLFSSVRTSGQYADFRALLDEASKNQLTVEELIETMEAFR